MKNINKIGKIVFPLSTAWHVIKHDSLTYLYGNFDKLLPLSGTLSARLVITIFQKTGHIYFYRVTGTHYKLYARVLIHSLTIPFPAFPAHNDSCSLCIYKRNSFCRNWVLSLEINEEAFRCLCWMCVVTCARNKYYYYYIIIIITPQQHTSTKLRNYRKQPYWAQHTNCGKCCCKGTGHSTWEITLHVAQTVNTEQLQQHVP
jgi:hypothetical protein